MTENNPTRNLTRIAVVIVIAAAIVLATLFSYSSLETSGTKTAAQTEASDLYQVQFTQESNCPYGSWVAPWGVAINGRTLTQPSNATLPLSSDPIHITGDSDYSTISFSLPNGTYNYAILPVDPLGSAQSGNVTVDGSDVAVQVYAFIMAMGCSSTINSSPSEQSSTSSTCSGSPPDGDCPSIFSYTFTISVNYTGPWSLTFEGCSSTSTCTSPAPIMGSVNGTGYYSKAVTLTSLPYGTTSYCGGVVP